MTKDYAKRHQSHSRPKGREDYFRPVHIRKSSFLMPSWAWLMTGLILASFLAGGLYWKLRQPGRMEIATNEKSPSQPRKKITSTKKSNKTHSTENSSRFDFYTLLPAMTMDVPDAEEMDPASKGTTNVQSVAKAAEPASSTYLIQIGSFRKLEQAEELKAQLAFTGIEASIQTIKETDNSTRYRVYMGPYQSKESATIKQQEIQKAQQLRGLIVKNHV